MLDEFLNIRTSVIDQFKVSYDVKVNKNGKTGPWEVSF